jgi:hypothetical protein
MAPSRAGNQTDRAAIVCSARSTKNKTEGTTNRLLRSARAAEHQGHRGYDDIVEAIRADHVQAGKDTLQNPDILASFTEEVNAECESLTKILESAQHLEEVTNRAEDKIIAKGEKLSCRYMAAQRPWHPCPVRRSCRYHHLRYPEEGPERAVLRGPGCSTGQRGRGMRRQGASHHWILRQRSRWSIEHHWPWIY